MTDHLLSGAADRAVADALRRALSSEKQPEGQVDSEHWRQLARAGWLELLLESDEPIAQTIPGYLDVLEVLGQSPAAGPLTISIGLIAPLIAASGQPSLRDALNEGRVFTATPEVSAVDPGPIEISARSVGGRLVLDGRSDLVPWLAEADEVIVLAEQAGGGLTLVSVSCIGEGVDAVHTESIDPGTSAGSIILSGAEGVRLDVPGDALAIARAAYSLVIDAQAVGAAAELVRRTVEYVNRREQFGQAVGSFQAVKHRVAEMVRVTETARSMLWLASSRFAASPTAPPWEDIDASRVCAGDAARRAAVEAIQCFGGMGFTWEQGLHHFYRRTLLTGSLHGNVEAASRRLVRYGVARAARSK